MTELNDERATVRKALQEREIEVLCFEELGARPETPQNAYLAAVREADLYLGLFWNRYSPATEEEYRKALRLGRPCLIYVKDFDVHRDEELTTLLAEIGRRWVYKTFSDVTELHTQVQRDLQQLLIGSFHGLWSKRGSIVRREIPRITVSDALLDGLRPENPEPIARLVRRVMGTDRSTQLDFVEMILPRLTDPNEDVRWLAASVVEHLVEWDPTLVGVKTLVEMAEDASFSVRSSAAVCFYKLAHSNPGAVPLGVLGRLASAHEDWYVTMPATATLLTLARSRSVVLGILQDWVESRDDADREHAAWALMRLAQQDPDLVPVKLLQRLAQDSFEAARYYASEGLEALERAGHPERRVYTPF